MDETMIERVERVIQEKGYIFPLPKEGIAGQCYTFPLPTPPGAR